MIIRVVTIAALLGGAALMPGQEAAKLEVDGVTFSVPEGWKSVEPKSSMRKAEFQISVVGVDKPITAAVFHFPGGDVAMNLGRWKAQLTGTVDSKTEEVDASGVKVTLFQGTGTYTDPFSGEGAQENYALIGALVPVEGSAPIVIKIAGPKEPTLKLYDVLKKMAQAATKK